jgi:hypothetical protein
MTGKHCSIHATIAAALIVLSTTPAMAEEAPKRKPGLWQITTIGVGTGMSTVEICIGDDDKILTPADSGDCAEPMVKSGGEDTTIVDVVCTNGESKETISGAFTGDFNSKYRAQVKLSYDPPPTDMPPHWGVTVEGTFLRPDCAPAEPVSGTK